MKTSQSDMDKLLDLYFSGELPDDLTRIVQGWLADEENRAEKDAGLFVIFSDYMSRKRQGVDDYTRTSLSRIHRELNFSDRTIRPVAIPLTRRRLFRRAVVGFAAAAAVLAAIQLPRIFVNTASELPVSELVTVTAGLQTAKEVTLPDGSRVRLKSGSTITYAENFAENRSVNIIGEAFFTVERDELHPFTVEANDVKVTVLGTEFNLKALAGDATAEVMLASGSVEVRTGETVAVLKPSEMARIDRARNVIELQEIGEQEMMRIRGINLSFDDVTFDAALAMIADYYGVRIEAAADIPDTGGIVMRMDDGATLEQTLFILQQINPVFHYEIEDGKVTIRKR